jgi:hypothetical protein
MSEQRPELRDWAAQTVALLDSRPASGNPLRTA